MKQKTDHKIISLLEIFRKIEEYNNQEKTINIYAIICQLEKKDEKTYLLFLQNIRNSFKLNMSIETYQENKELLIVHNELLFTLKIGIKNGSINSLICEKISDIN